METGPGRGSCFLSAPIAATARVVMGRGHSVEYVGPIAAPHWHAPTSLPAAPLVGRLPPAVGDREDAKLVAVDAVDEVRRLQGAVVRALHPDDAPGADPERRAADGPCSAGEAPRAISWSAL